MVLAMALSLLWVDGALATNGLLLPGYTTRSSALGGAVTALPGSGMDVQANPALLALNAGNSFELGMRAAQLRTTYQDSLRPPGSASVDNKTSTSMQGLLPYGGLVNFLGEQTAIGFAGFVQGGGGGTVNLQRRVPGGVTLAEHTGLPLPESYVLQERLSARMGSLRFALGAARRVGSWTFGLSADAVVGVLQISNDYAFPGSSVHVPGSGFEFRSRTSVAPGASAGVAYSHGPWTFGLSHSPRVELSPDGDAQIGAGNVSNYRRSGVSLRQSWPAVTRAGFAYQIGRWVLVGDVRRIGWAKAFETMALIFADPWVETPYGVRSHVVVFRHRWQDQNILSAGAEYQGDLLIMRIGYNYGRTPLTPEGLNPLFGATTEHHLAAGLGWQNDSVRYDLALEYGLPRTLKGGLASDWAIAHAVLGRDNVLLPYFRYSKRTWTASVIFGITRSLGKG